MSIEMAELKARLLKLLEEDTEFRYAVAGLIGLNEILRRLDRHEEELVRIREEQKKIWEEIRKIWEEIKSIREEQKSLREDFRKMLMRVQRIERTLEHISIAIEDEAQDAVAWFLSKYGIAIQITDIRIDERYGFDIYGSTDSFTIIGDAKVRASIKTLKRLLSRIEEVRKIRPEIFRGRTIPVLYCLKFVGDPIEAEKMGIWLIKSDKELTKLKL